MADGELVSKVFEVDDAIRERKLPLRIYLPETATAAPVILFSHGLGGSRDNNAYLGKQWAKRGYVVVFVQHPGSDESVWKELPPAERMAAMKQAASVGAFLDRAKDIPAVIDALARWNVEDGHALHGRLDLARIGMSGHSFGAVTTQAVAGQAVAGGRQRFLEPRISAAVMFSPSIPRMGDPATAFAAIKMPCLLMTGTKDSSPIGNMSPADRLKVFPNLTQAPAWQIVFDGAEHMSFGSHGSKGGAKSGNRFHKPILALTTAFWDSELRGDERAKAWLNGNDAKSVLTPEDQWSINERAKN